MNNKSEMDGIEREIIFYYLGLLQSTCGVSCFLCLAQYALALTTVSMWVFVCVSMSVLVCVCVCCVWALSILVDIHCSHTGTLTSTPSALGTMANAISPKPCSLSRCRQNCSVAFRCGDATIRWLFGLTQASGFNAKIYCQDFPRRFMWFNIPFSWASFRM